MTSKLKNLNHPVPNRGHFCQNRFHLRSGSETARSSCNYEEDHFLLNDGVNGFFSYKLPLSPTTARLMFHKQSVHQPASTHDSDTSSTTSPLQLLVGNNPFSTDFTISSTSCRRYPDNSNLFSARVHALLCDCDPSSYICLIVPDVDA